MAHLTFVGVDFKNSKKETLWVIMLFQPRNKLLPFTPIFSNKQETFMPFGLDCLVGEKYSHTLMPFGYRGHDMLTLACSLPLNAKAQTGRDFANALRHTMLHRGKLAA